MEFDAKAAKKTFSKVGLRYFFGTIIIFAAQILCIAVAKQVLSEGVYAEYSFLIPMIAMYVIGMPLTFLLIKTVPKADEPVEKKKMTVFQIIIAFAICYAGMYISNILGNILATVIGIVKGGAVNNAITDIILNNSLIINLIIVTLCAPVFEEILFRKMLIDRVVQYGEGVAVVLSALMFGLFHGNIYQFCYAFVIGMLLAFIYVKTRNIKYSIIIHIIINFLGSGLSVLILKFSGIMELMSLDYTAMEPEQMLEFFSGHVAGLMVYMLYSVLIMAIVVLGIVMFFVKKKSFTFNSKEGAIPKGKRFNTVILNVGMILFCLFWIVNIIIATIA